MSEKPALHVLPGRYALCRLEPAVDIPAWATGWSFSSITRTSTELSVVCDEENVPEHVKCERGWRVLGIDGPPDVGVISDLARRLADASIGAFIISSVDTDRLRVRRADLRRTVVTLRESGHRIGLAGISHADLSAALEPVDAAGRVVVVRFDGVCPPGSAGNPIGNRMVDFLEQVIAVSDPQGVVLDLTGLQYEFGDVIAWLPTPLLLADGRFRPAALVAVGPTARALAPLLRPPFLAGVAGVRLFQTRGDALSHVATAAGVEAAARPETRAPSPAGVNRAPRCRLVACPLPIGWEFFLINDGNDVIDEAVLQEIEYEWGDVSSQETVSGSTSGLRPGKAARLWRGTIEDELRMELLVRVRRGDHAEEVRFAFPMLYRHREDLQLIPELGKKGWQEFSS